MKPLCIQGRGDRSYHQQQPCCHALNTAHHYSIFLLALALVLSTLTQIANAQDPINIEVKSCLAEGCHAELRAPRYVHAPVIQGDCQICHKLTQEPDAEGFVPHVFETAIPNYDLCGQCHTQLDTKAEVVHQPFKEECTACHNPHSGDCRQGPIYP